MGRAFLSCVHISRETSGCCDLLLLLEWRLCLEMDSEVFAKLIQARDGATVGGGVDYHKSVTKK
jgi:hypothetical protein